MVYSDREQDPVRQRVYDYIQDLAVLPPQQAIDTFYSLFWDGISPDQGVLKAIREITAASDFSETGLLLLNRCYYTLGNRWHLDGNHESAVRELILKPEQLSSKRPAQSQTIRRLRGVLQDYVASEYYTVLKRHRYLLNDATAQSSTEQTMATTFNRYFFLYVEGTRTQDIEDAPGKLSEGIEIKRDRKLLQLREELKHFIQFIQCSDTATAESLNPTHLPPKTLSKLIHHYHPKTERSFQSRANAFCNQAHSLRTMKEYKHLLYERQLKPILAQHHESPWHEHKFKQLVGLKAEDQHLPIQPMSEIQMMRQILNGLIRQEGFRGFGHTVVQIGKKVITDILLSLVLTCNMARFDLEKQLAYLFAASEKHALQTMQWLVELFDYLNVALALNAKWTGHLNVDRWEGGFDSI